jgi:uncharacterized protein YkwD
MKHCLSLIPALSLLACDVDDETVTRVADGVIGAGLAADADEAEGLDELDDYTAEGRPALACSDAGWNAAWASLEDQVLTLVNQRRAAGATCGGVAKPPVAALTSNAKLRCAARNHSKDMGSKNFFSHTGSNGSTFVQRIEAALYKPWLALAENIAAGQTTAAAVVNGWMSSTGHCNNIMNGNYKHLGVGYFNAPSSTYKHYWTQDFGKQ